MEQFTEEDAQNVLNGFKDDFILSYNANNIIALTNIILDILGRALDKATLKKQFDAIFTYLSNLHAESYVINSQQSVEAIIPMLRHLSLVSVTTQ